MPTNLQAMYEGILAAVGGAENIATLGNCMTRLRFTVKDETLVQTDKLRAVKDVAGYFHAGSPHQVIVGPSTATVWNAMHVRRFPAVAHRLRPRTKLPLPKAWATPRETRPPCAKNTPASSAAFAPSLVTFLSL